MKRATIAIAAAALLMPAVGLPASGAPHARLADGTALARAVSNDQGRPGAADARPAARDAKGTAVIRGRVLAADSGRPVRGATVTATFEAVRRSARTGADGQFTWIDLPPGRYRVHAAAPGFVGLDLGEDAERGGGRDITLGDGERFERADLTLPRGGVVAGRVTDEAGEGIEGVQVQAFSVEYVAGLERLAPARGATVKRSNDLGRYRVYGLAPGDYYVVASPGMFVGTGTDAEMSAGYAITYFPGVPDAASAQLVKVSAGQETRVDFPLVPGRGFELSGMVADTSGTPAAGATLILTPGGNVSIAVMARATVAGDGTFRFLGVPPGPYLLQTMPGPGAKVPFASQAVNVNGHTRGVVLQARPSPVAQGEFVFEGGQPDFKPQDLRITAMPADFTRSPMIGYGFPQDMRDDWTFELRDLWGPRLLNVTAPPGWALKAVQLGGIDMTDRPMDFDRENVGRLRIVLTNSVTHVSGAVTREDGQPAAQVPVIVFSSDRERWDFQSRFLALVTTDENGRYDAAALPPGDYRAVALPAVKSGFGWQRPSFLEALFPDSVRLVLREGERTSVDLKVRRGR